MTRRHLAPQMPALSAIYGLDWDKVEAMPHYELREYLDQLETWGRVLSGIHRQ